MAHFSEGSSSLEGRDMAIPYYHVDSFAGELFAGNPGGAVSFPPFSRIAPCRKLRLRTGTATPLLLFLARMVISTCAGLHPKSRTTFAGTRPWHLPVCSRCGSTTCGR